MRIRNDPNRGESKIHITEMGLVITSAGFIISSYLYLRQRRIDEGLRCDMAVLNAEIQTAYDGIIEGWAAALDMRDHESAGHSRRVSAATTELARHMGIKGQALLDIKRGASLHDIGKISVPDRILLKPVALDEVEWRIMKRHPEDAAVLLSSVPYLGNALEIPLCHHEKWDGNGYPKGLAGSNIPLAARIFAVIDVWDALLSDRPYRKALSEDDATGYIQSKAGIEFDPEVVTAFLECLPQIKRVLGSASDQRLNLNETDLLGMRTSYPAQQEQSILIVDDSDSAALLIESILKNEGYRLLIAANGWDAIHIAQTDFVDLVLLDVVIPDMDGYEICRYLKSNPVTKDIPVIFTTVLGESEDETKGLQLGAVDYLTKPICSQILRARVRNHLELKKYRDSLESICMIDSLTGLPNRRMFEGSIEKEWRRALRMKEGLSLLFIDIDDFKEYNKSLGFAAGDECLKKVASILGQSAKRAGDTLVRYGGQEFVLISFAESSEGALRLGYSLCCSVREKTTVSVCIGIVSATPGNGITIADITEKGKQALRQAKQKGPNSMVIFSDE